MVFHHTEMLFKNVRFQVLSSYLFFADICMQVRADNLHGRTANVARCAVADSRLVVFARRISVRVSDSNSLSDVYFGLFELLGVVIIL